LTWTWSWSWFWKALWTRGQNCQRTQCSESTHVTKNVTSIGSRLKCIVVVVFVVVCTYERSLQVIKVSPAYVSCQ